MGAKADRTRQRIMDATLALVAREGYAQATIRAIAAEAGIAEGTIYRHFPDKSSILLEAVERHEQPVDAWLEELPARAGQATVQDNLTACLMRLAVLRDEVLPLEVAMLTDRELREARRRRLADGQLPAPVRQLSAYLAAEQAAGRVRAGIEPFEAAMLVLAVLFGVAVGDLDARAASLEPVIRRSVELLVGGLGA